MQRLSATKQILTPGQNAFSQILIKQFLYGFLIVLCLSLSACSAIARHYPSQTYTPTQTFPQEEILQAQGEQARHIEVTVTAQVVKLLRDDTEGLPHERFLIGLNNGTTVLVAHDTKMAPRVPLQAGDVVTIHGEYIWTEKGGVLHWTHHTDTIRHPGGYIEFNGKRYE
jgi:translation initiation factor IF-1